MQKHTIEDSIRKLKSLRDTYHSQLDISAIAELDVVIAQLAEVGCQKDAVQKQQACLRALQAIADFIKLVSNIRDLM